MKNKKLILATVALVVMIGLLVGVYFLAGPGRQTDSGATTGTDASGNTISGCHFTVTVVHSDKTEKTFTYTAPEGKLGAFLEAEGLIVGSGDGMFHTVDGEKADWSVNQSYWAFYLNGEYAISGIYDTDIVDNMVYKLEYTLG